jgi:hypothetical protein
MKIKFLRSTLIAFFIGLSQWACQVNPETKLDPIANSPITVNEAKDWYEQRSPAKARVANRTEGELAFWKYAIQSKLTNGVDVVAVPLLYNANAPVSVTSDENFVNQGDKHSLPAFDRKAYEIQQKLLISKDEQGNFRSVVITVISDRKDQRKKQPVKKDKFSGVVLLMNESGDGFDIGWRYKNGKGVDIFYPAAKTANGRQAAYSCMVGIYQKVAQSNSGAWNCSSNSSVCLPVSFIDVDGGFWVMIGDPIEASCDDGVPNGAPTRQNPWDDKSSWVVADPNRGGAGGGPILRDPFNPASGETPIDHGMPNDLNPVDAFVWEMANRIGPNVYLDSPGIEFLYENFDFSYDFRDYISLNNIKPDLGKNLNGWFYDENDLPSNKIQLKVVGRDSYNEETDYRLYTRECEAYTYLFDKANSSGQEYGAYITTKGIIVLPNSQAKMTSNGTRSIEFLIWKISKTSNRRIVPTSEGTYQVRGFIHTHPTPPGLASPSTADQQFAGRHPGVSHYVMNQFNINQFFSDGRTQLYGGVFEKRCP